MGIPVGQVNKHPHRIPPSQTAQTQSGASTERLRQHGERSPSHQCHQCHQKIAPGSESR